MSLAALDAVDDAIEATKRFLIPFDRARWFRLAVIMLFIAGAGGSFPQFPTGGFGGDTGETDPGTGAEPGDPSVPSPELTGELLVFIVALVAFVLAVVLLWSIVSATMEFVFVEALNREEVRLWTPLKRHVWRGVRLFVFRVGLWLLAATLVGGVLLAAGFALGGSPSAWDAGVALGLLLLAIPLFLVVALVLGTTIGFTNMFVVPVMYQEERGVLSGWRRFWPTLRNNLKEYLVYLVVGFLLGIAIGIASGFLTLIVVLVIGIPFAVVAVPAFLLFGFGGAGAIVLVVLGLAFFVVVFVALLLVKVPFQTFLRYYALFVLGDTNPEFDVIPDARRAVRTDGGDDESGGGDGTGGGGPGTDGGPGGDAPGGGGDAPDEEWGTDREWGDDTGEGESTDSQSWNVDDDERF
jgi:hypothetical protein